MTAEAEVHDNFDTTRLNEQTDYLILIKGKNVTTTFLPQTIRQRMVDESDLTIRLHTYLTGKNV